MQCMLNLEIRSLIEMLNLGQMTLIYGNYLVLNQYQLRVEAWGWWHLKMVTVDLAPLRSRPWFTTQLELVQGPILAIVSNGCPRSYSSAYNLKCMNSYIWKFAAK